MPLVSWVSWLMLRFQFSQSLSKPFPLDFNFKTGLQLGVSLTWLMTSQVFRLMETNVWIFSDKGRERQKVWLSQYQKRFAKNCDRRFLFSRALEKDNHTAWGDATLVSKRKDRGSPSHSALSSHPLKLPSLLLSKDRNAHFSGILLNLLSLEVLFMDLVMKMDRCLINSAIN